MANQHLYCLYKPRLFTLLAQEHSHTHSVGYKEKTWSASWLRHWPVVEAVSLDWPGRGRRFRAKEKARSATWLQALAWWEGWSL